MHQAIARPWPAIAVARAGPASARVPFFIEGVNVGSVAAANLGLLHEHRDVLHVGADRIALRAAAHERDDVLAAINARLRERGAILAWRDELYPVVDPASEARLATIERASARFWGTLTFGAHATGYTADEHGRPTHLWIAQRSLHKATDPGLADNLVGGGVPAGQTPHEALLREGWEEAGLTVEQMRRARPGRRIRLWREVREGLQHEWLSSFDLLLAGGEVPANQDGEVAGFRLLPIERALAIAAGALDDDREPAMTVDAALVTLDFALRHHLIAEPAPLEAAAQSLWLGAVPAI